MRLRMRKNCYMMYKCVMILRFYDVILIFEVRIVRKGIIWENK